MSIGLRYWRKFFSTRCLYVIGGQGTQQKGMLNSILTIQEAKTQVQHISHELNIDFIQIATTDAGQLINQTQITQPLLVLSHYLFAKYKLHFCAAPTHTLIGHSVGEYSALALTHSIPLLDCLRIVRRRGQLMTEVSKGGAFGMLIIKFNFQQKSDVLSLIRTKQGAKMSIACHNTPHNIIVGGDKSELEDLRKQLRKQKVSSLFLPVSTAFHCQLLEPMKKHFRSYLDTFTFQQPSSTILRNLDSQSYRDSDHIKQGLTEHLTSCVQFWQSVEKWRSEGRGEVIEIGHKEFVKKFADQTLSLI